VVVLATSIKIQSEFTITLLCVIREFKRKITLFLRELHITLPKKKETNFRIFLEFYDNPENLLQAEFI